MAPVVPAVDAWIKTLPEDIQKSPEAALARSVAGSIDHDATSATATAPLGKLLVELLDRLRALAPREEQEDQLDALRKRLTGRSAA